jgi:ferredoxin
MSERSERTISHTAGVSIDPERCQGHGRCYELAREVFGADDEGYGVVLGDGAVPADLRERARLAELNCPESAIDLVDVESEATGQ